MHLLAHREDLVVKSFKESGKTWHTPADFATTGANCHCFCTSIQHHLQGDRSLCKGNSHKNGFK